MINHDGCLTRGGCAEMHSAINLSTCCQLWKIINHNEAVLFLYCYSKLKDRSTHIFPIPITAIIDYSVGCYCVYVMRENTKYAQRSGC